MSGGALRRAWPRVRDGQRKGGERMERRGQGHTDDVRGVKRGKGGEQHRPQNRLEDSGRKLSQGMRSGLPTSGFVVSTRRERCPR